MRPPFRLYGYGKPPGGRAVPAQQKVTGAEEFQAYLDRLLRLIPAEILGLYMVGEAIFSGRMPMQLKWYADPPPTKLDWWLSWLLFGWSVVCFGILFVVRIRGNRNPKKPDQPVQKQAVGLAAVAYVLWMLYLAKPIAPLLDQLDPLFLKEIWPRLTAGAVVLFTFLVPYFVDYDPMPPGEDGGGTEGDNALENSHRS
jgi:hypothetical protein